jgi:uncharacterized protein YbjT (DUF2867 family)
MSTRFPVVVVTGAAGFVGLHTVAACLRHGYRVRATVRNADDAAKTQPIRSLANGNESNLEIVSLNLQSPIDSWIRY